MSQYSSLDNVSDYHDIEGLNKCAIESSSLLNSFISIALASNSVVRIRIENETVRTKYSPKDHE